LAAAFYSCAKDFEPAPKKNMPMQGGTDVEFYYTPRGTQYFDVRKDRVIIKTSSTEAADKLSGSDIFVCDDYPADSPGVWVIAAIDPRETSLDDILKLPGVVDAAYGLDNGALKYPTDRIAVQFSGTTPREALEKISLDKSVADIESYHENGGIHRIALNVKLGDILPICRELYESRSCAWTEPGFFMDLELANPYYPDQWGLKNSARPWTGMVAGIDIRAERAWTITRGSPDIKVAVFDTGVDLSHPDLQANLLPGYDAVPAGMAPPVGAPGSPAANDDGHGTNCAGIIAAVDNNIGVIGVAPGCKIVPIRIGYQLGGGTLFRANKAWIADGIRYAWETAGADVLSNSWVDGTNSYEHEIHQAMLSAMTQGRGGKGCVVVCGSGNDDRNTVSYPAASDQGIVAVGAVMYNGKKAGPPYLSGWGSNYGTALDVVAPGVGVYTTAMSGNYFAMDGTSAATPYAAGVAALILSKYPNYTRRQVVDCIERSAQKLGGYNYTTTPEHAGGAWNNETGYGLVDAFGALMSPLSITGQDAVNLNTTYTYTATTPPGGITFSGWTVSGGTSSNYTVTGGTSGTTLRISFSGQGNFTINAKYTFSGNATHTVGKALSPGIPRPQLLVSEVSRQNGATIIVTNSQSGAMYEWEYNGHGYGITQGAELTIPYNDIAAGLNYVRSRARVNGGLLSDWSGFVDFLRP
jgi:subtilisin family serine protease